MHNTQGFTLVELVTTIIVIGILSVFVLPRMMTSSSYSAFTLRAEFISELRKVQLLAMNNQDRCYMLVVDASGYQLQRFTPTPTSPGCTGAPSRTEAKQDFEGGASLQLISDSSNSFNVGFDGMGVSTLTCSGACIDVIADETQVISIESQGYIYGS